MNNATFRCLREAMGLTIEQIAEHLDVDQRTISRWESDAKIPPGVESDMDDLVERFRCEVAQARGQVPRRREDVVGGTMPPRWYRAAAGIAMLDHRSESVDYTVPETFREYGNYMGQDPFARADGLPWVYDVINWAEKDGDIPQGPNALLSRDSGSGHVLYVIGDRAITGRHLEGETWARGYMYTLWERVGDMANPKWPAEGEWRAVEEGFAACPEELTDAAHEHLT